MRENLQLQPVTSSAKLPATCTGITFAACASIGFATWAATAIIPDDISGADALFLPALCLTIGLIVPILLQLRSNLTAVLRIENALMIGIVYWLLLDMLQSAYPFELVSPTDVRTAFEMVGVFALAIWLG